MNRPTTNPHTAIAAARAAFSADFSRFDVLLDRATDELANLRSSREEFFGAVSAGRRLTTHSDRCSVAAKESAGGIGHSAPQPQPDDVGALNPIQQAPSSQQGARQ